MNAIGERIRLTVFGEENSAAAGVVIDGLPAGEAVDIVGIREELERVVPGEAELGSAGSKKEEPVITTGIFEGRTTGAPLCILLRSTDRSTAPNPPNPPNLPRPGFPDLAALTNRVGHVDYRNGVPYIGRVTSAIKVAGAVCGQLLARRGVRVQARVVQIGAARSDELNYDMKKELLDARSGGDSVGGVVECVAVGLPIGLGAPVFGGIEGKISAMLFALPGVRGVEFGAGFGVAEMRGSVTNDPIRAEDGRVFMATNNAGGVIGGLTNGMPLVVRCAIAPTPGIAREQNTVDLATMSNTTIRIRGQHEPSLAPRSVISVEAAVTICLLDAMLD